MPIGGEHKCAKCGKTFKNVIDFLEHYEKEHKPANKEGE